MARKARQRISYVLPLAHSSNGHRLGVNGLAVDGDRSILYSGGRDGLICAWNLSLELQGHSHTTLNPSASSDDPPPKPTSTPASSATWRAQVQAHTHWVNDIALAHNGTILVSASSDLTVKAWRPHAEGSTSPHTVGLHSDYVKCLATPSLSTEWIASGGLDHKIILWDLGGGGERLKIDVSQEEQTAKGSVYALGVGGNIIASGGPESIVRVWDVRSGKRITKFVGHTDNVRDILINAYDDTIMTASSDQTVKVWSVTAGRCMHTLSMHNDSVWSLHSDHPQLAVFYSSDRSGLVAKTDVRRSMEMEDGISVAICQEHEGVAKVVSKGGHVWTATPRSSINRWTDVDTAAEMYFRDLSQGRPSSQATGRRKSSKPNVPTAAQLSQSPRRQIALRSFLRISNAASFPPSSRDIDTLTQNSSSSVQNGSGLHPRLDDDVVVPHQTLPAETIEGQNGLIKHVLLNDRRRVLTLDTAGEVVLWDLVRCEAVQSFGKRHLEDCAAEVNTTESVANWCAVDTRTGRLACVLEENYCFDGEMYADELGPKATDFREDQRINLGKWVLRYLFGQLIEAEIQRDEAYREGLMKVGLQQDNLRRGKGPASIQIPPSAFAGWDHSSVNDDALDTPRASNGLHHPPPTPGLHIGVATPAVSHPDNNPTPTAEDGSALEKRSSQSNPPRASGDYFSTASSSQSGIASTEAEVKAPAPATEVADERTQTSPTQDEHEAAPKEGTSLFGKKFRIAFGSKKKTAAADPKPVVIDEKPEESDASSARDSRKELIEDNFLGVVQKLRNDYLAQIREDAQRLPPTGISVSQPNDTPVLQPPPFTPVIIQEDRPDTGGVADLYRGTVDSLGADADLLEKVAPAWLGNLLLRNQMPIKDTVKISFILLPYQDLLPNIASADGNSRLNANRMLRVRKILAYVAERIEKAAEVADENALKPEEYLELYCQNQLVSPLVTLATLRTHLWRTGGDVMLYYKSNGRRKIPGERTAEEAKRDKVLSGAVELGDLNGRSSMSQ
ncbi:MAG: hypothetical protein M1817_005460 [Caeruleum heppii]|nr:MAG: hypothetical protein M1817_005460 [Caeruleum heppii]